jgi:hypothetical protein
MNGYAPATCCLSRHAELWAPLQQQRRSYEQIHNDIVTTASCYQCFLLIITWLITSQERLREATGSVAPQISWLS